MQNEMDLLVQQELDLELAKYLDGKGTPYEPVIKSLRDFLSSISELKPSVGGAIVFFKKKDKKQGGDLMMQVFPFKKNLSILTDKSIDPSIVLKLFKIINQPKPYHEFWHFDTYKRFHKDRDKHFVKEVPEDSILNYDQFTPKDWKEFYLSLEKGDIDKNKYEQILLCSGCDKVALIPLPILSTPSILLVIDYSFFDLKKANLLRLLYFRSRDTIAKYLYTRLLYRLTEALDENLKEEEDLLNLFIDELCDVILPISYQIGERNPQRYYNWPATEKESIYILNLVSGKTPPKGEKQLTIRVRFTLTSFSYYDFSEELSDEGKLWQLIHLNNLYNSIVSQSALMVEDLYKLIHRNWELRKTADERAAHAIQNLFKDINVDSVKGQINTLFENLESLKGLGLTIIDKNPRHTIKISEYQRRKFQVTIIVRHQEIFFHQFDNCSEKNNNGRNQLAGFQYLYYIIKSSQSGITTLSSYDLYENADTILGKSDYVHAGTTAEKNAFVKQNNQTIQDELEVIETHVRQLANDLNNTKDVASLIYLNVNNEWVRQIAYVAALLKTTYSNKVQLTGLKAEIDTINRVTAQLNRNPLFADLVNGYLGEVGLTLNSSKKELRANDTKQKIQERIRGSFKAMLSLINKQVGTTDSEKNKTLLFFLKNLETSGLTNKLEPKSQSQFTYNQTNTENFIQWELD